MKNPTTVRCEFRASRTQRQSYNRAAKHAGVSLNQWVRQALDEATPEHKETDRRAMALIRKFADGLEAAEREGSVAEE